MEDDTDADDQDDASRSRRRRRLPTVPCTLDDRQHGSTSSVHAGLDARLEVINHRAVVGPSRLRDPLASCAALLDSRPGRAGHGRCRSSMDTLAGAACARERSRAHTSSRLGLAQESTPILGGRFVGGSCTPEGESRLSWPLTIPTCQHPMGRTHQLFAPGGRGE